MDAKKAWIVFLGSFFPHLPYVGVLIACDEEEDLHWMMVLEAMAKALKFRRKLNGL